MGTKGIDELYSNVFSELEDYFDLLASKSITSALESLPINTESIEVVENVILSFDLEKIFQRVYKLTSLRARMLSKELGLPFEDLVFSVDEKELLFYENCQDAADEVFKKLFHLGKNITEAYLFNKGDKIPEFHVDETPYDINVLVYANGVLYESLIENNTSNPVMEVNREKWAIKPEYYDTYNKAIYVIALENLNSDILQNWIKVIEDIMVNYVLKEWYKILGVLGEASIKETDYDKKLSELKFLTFFKQKHVRRSVGWG